MQHLTFASQYEQISGPDPNLHVNISATNETEPGSIPTLSLDQILNYCDVTPATSFAYFPLTTSTNSATFNSVTSSFDYVPPQTISASGANILETPLNSISKHTLEPDDVKSFAERTVLLPNPPCYVPYVSNGETIDDIQVLNRTTFTDDSLNSTYSDCYFQMRLISEPSQMTSTQVIASCPQGDNIYNCQTDPEGQFSWWERHPDTWTLSDILDWIKFTIHRDTINPTYQCGEGFKDLTSGACLRYMSYEEFLMRDPHYGHILFHYFKQLLDLYAHATMGSEMREISSPQQFDQTNITINQFSPYESDATTTQPNIFIPTQKSSDHGNSYTNLVVPKYSTQFNEPDVKTRVDVSFPITKFGRSGLKTFDKYENPKRKPGRPRLHPGFRSNVASNKKIKILPLWEFIYSTLQNEHFNPSVIKWEDETNGKFRFVHSEKFAKLWGNAKNNDNMNYEKLSRAMRHYYGKDIMERVEGRRLVYRFLSPALERLRKKQDPDVPLSETQRPPELIRSI